MIAFVIIVVTLTSYAVGWLIGIPVLLPVLNTLAAFPFMIAALRRGDLGLAIARMLVWGLMLGVCATLLSYAQPARTDTLFLRGAAYRIEMLAWVMTGRGAESTPSQFIPQHIRDAAVFAALALGSGGFAAMTLGAVLMNEMGHYAGTLAAVSAHPILTSVLAWHPWAVVRIASFVVMGVVLAVPLWSRVGGVRIDWRAARRDLAWALAGLVVDVVMKALLAPAWQRLLWRLVRG